MNFSVLGVHVCCVSSYSFMFAVNLGGKDRVGIEDFELLKVLGTGGNTAEDDETCFQLHLYNYGYQIFAITCQ